jgi:hypothetical protein
MLVTAEGKLELLDFGIARMIGGEDHTQTLRTRTGAAPMTIEYASPEQIRGETVGPRSDVYSLGVVLYELLTGSRPYRTQARLPHLIARAICEEQPATPSSAVVEPPQPAGQEITRSIQEISDLRSDKPHRLRRRLSGDLDSIVLKALRKSPQWRYESPAALSDDIGRHLAGLRVTARKDTVRYRAEKILNRLLHPADGIFHSHGMLMLTAGLLGFVLFVERQIIAWGWKSGVNVKLGIAVVCLWLIWAIWEGRRMTRVGKFSPLDRQAWIVFTVITAVLGCLTIASVLRPLVRPDALAIFWNVGLGIGLLIVGLQANAWITAGGIALVSSALIAHFYPAWVYLCLAGGMLAGMVVPGALLTATNRSLPK